MYTSEQTLRIVLIDHATGETGVSEIPVTRYDLADTDTRNQLVAEVAAAAVDNLTRLD